jgi:hypothetical protein
MLNSFIAHIKVDGVLVTNKDDKGKAVDTFYDQLFGSSLEHGFSLHLDHLGMASHDLSGLEVPFTKEVVWQYICSPELDKATGPDGSTIKF